MTTTEKEATVVIEISGQHLDYLVNIFENAFPAERDDLLPHIPEIRRQMQTFQIYHEEDVDPPGYLRLDRKTAEQLAELLDKITEQPRGSYEVDQATSEITQQLQSEQPDNPDIRVLYGTRYAWTEVAPGGPDPYVLITTQNGEDLIHPNRFRLSHIATDKDEIPIYRVNLKTEQMKTVLAIPQDENRRYTVQIEDDMTLRLVSVGDN